MKILWDENFINNLLRKRISWEHFYVYERQNFDSKFKYDKLHSHYCISNFEFKRFNQSFLKNDKLRVYYKRKER